MKILRNLLVALAVGASLAACSSGSGLHTVLHTAATAAIGTIDPCQVVPAAALQSVYGMTFQPAGPAGDTADGGRACTYKSDQGVAVTLTVYPDLNSKRYQQAVQSGQPLPGVGSAVVDPKTGLITVHSGPFTVTLLPVDGQGKPLSERAEVQLALAVLGLMGKG